ncbi:MAG TPA: hypothetical protein VJU16_02395, partial [Planctomycetota bacterium]|nr:hypothetical protein [Planctomycetota bacterium]
MTRIIFIATLLAAAASAPLALSRREPPVRPGAPEIVSMPGLDASRRHLTPADFDLRPAWTAFVASRLLGAPCPPE